MNSSFLALILREFVWQVLIICIAASQSAHVDVRKLKNDVNDLKPSSLLKQEQGKNYDIY